MSSFGVGFNHKFGGDKKHDIFALSLLNRSLSIKRRYNNKKKKQICTENERKSNFNIFYGILCKNKQR